MKDKAIEKVTRSIKQMVEDITSDKESIVLFKNLAAKTRNYELAAQLRELELDYFPDKLSGSEELKIAKKTELALRMVGIDTSLKTAYIIHEGMKLYFKKGGNTDLMSTSKIEADADELFG